MIEIDQSGRIENTSLDSILAAANEFKFAVKISKRTKREVLKTLRSHGFQPEFIYLGIFSAELFILLKTIKTGKALEVRIDQEYTKQDGNIRSLVNRIAQDQKVDFSQCRLRFARIGRESPAHKLALGTLRGKLKADYDLPPKEILRLLVLK